MIERLEAEGGHPEDFLNEFCTFRSELRDFFNASSFTDMLDALRPSLDDGSCQVSSTVAFQLKAVDEIWIHEGARTRPVGG